MNRKRCMASVAGAALLMLCVVRPALADDKVEMSDDELDTVVAAGTAAAGDDKPVLLDVSRTTRNGTTIDVDGSFEVLDSAAQAALGRLIISDSAQSNLSSLININAVNSNVNVLLNLNISIDSNIGTVRQGNWNGVLPWALPPLPGGD